MTKSIPGFAHPSRTPPPADTLSGLLAEQPEATGGRPAEARVHHGSQIGTFREAKHYSCRESHDEVRHDERA